MKNQYLMSILCSAVITALSAGAADAAADRATVISAKRYLFPHMEFVTGYSLSNSSWNYEITVSATKNTEKTPSMVQFNNGIPNSSVPRLFSLTVNGIDIRNIQLNKDSLKRWEDPATGNAGCETVLNFDGAKIAVRIFMKKDSQLLFIRIAPDKSSVEPIKQIVFSNYACINLDRDPKKRWTNEPYAREFTSAKRTVKGAANRNRGVKLEPEENSLVFRDAKFNKNPAYMTFQMQSVAKASVLNGVYQKLTVELKPDFKEFTYAFWTSSKKKLTNAEFKALLKASPAMFKL